MSCTKINAAPEAAQAKPCPNPSTKAQASACDTCAHRDGSLPGDWHALDFFDRRAVAGQAMHRLECTAVPDARKPCLKKPQTVVPFGEDAAKTVALQCLATVQDSLRWIDGLLARMCVTERGLDEEEAAVDLLTEMALEQIQHLRAHPPQTLPDLEHQWFRLAALVQMMAANYPHQDSALSRCLNGVAVEFKVLPALWETVLSGQACEAPRQAPAKCPDDGHSLKAEG